MFVRPIFLMMSPVFVVGWGLASATEPDKFSEHTQKMLIDPWHFVLTRRLGHPPADRIGKRVDVEVL